MSEQQTPPRDAPDQPGRVGFFTTIGSVLAGFFGVQSETARHRDFSRGSPLMFIAVGLVLTGAFVGTLFLVVRMIMASVGAE